MILILKSRETLTIVNSSIDNILNERNNHSHIKRIKTENIDFNIFKNVMNLYVTNLRNTHEPNNINVEKLVNDIETSFHKSAKIATKKRPKCNTNVVSEGESHANYKDAIICDARNEYSNWKSVLSEGDPKRLWEKIDFNGKFKNSNITPENTCNEFAEFLETRCSLPYNHRNYENIKSDIFDVKMDSKISEDESIHASKRMNRKSAAKCGIPIGALLSVIYPILGLLVTLFNSVFTSSYPTSWKPFI